MLSSIEQYSEFVYGLVDTYPSVVQSQLVLSPRGVTIGVLERTIKFKGEILLRVFERLDFSQQRIVYYSYEVRQGDEQLYWYDPWPHPDDPSLIDTHPHHKHVPPDIKHHRVPAPNLSFTAPNLPALIEEVEATLTGDIQEGR